MDEVTEFLCLQRPQLTNDVFSILGEVLNTPQKYQCQARQQMRDRQIDPNDTPSKWPRPCTPTTRPTPPSPSPLHLPTGNLHSLTSRTRVERQYNNHDENVPAVSCITRTVIITHIISRISSCSTPPYRESMLQLSRILRTHFHHLPPKPTEDTR